MTQKEQARSNRVTYSAEDLYKLLPTVYRQRDETNGKPLLGLLTVISEQVGILEEDIERLYENWFIETCDAWVVPYIGDLVGARMLDSNARDAASRRSFVANTIAYRRSKGTTVVLEHLARDLTGWGAKAVEFFQLLGTTQNLNHLRPFNVRTPDLRDEDRLRLIDTPFDSSARTAECRSISLGEGLYNIPNIGVFLWSLQAFHAVNTPACPHTAKNGKTNGFSFNVLGLDTQLFSSPSTKSGAPQPAKETDLPIPITRLTLKMHLGDYYSDFEADKSIQIRTENGTVTAEEIIVCDLSQWTAPLTGVAVDPILGRIAFPSGKLPNKVHVDYFYGFGGEVGGGFYERPLLTVQKSQYFKIAKGTESNSIQAAFEKWKMTKTAEAIFEIADSEVYDETLSFDLPSNSKVEIRAAQGTRPLLSKPVTIMSPAGPVTDPILAQTEVTFNGLLFNEKVTVNEGDLRAFNIIHCTLRPRKSTLSLEVKDENNDLAVVLDHAISGQIDSYSSLSQAQIALKDSIVDAGGSKLAVSCYEINLERSTILGAVKTVLVSASNSIFTEPVTSRRRQMGCMRFSHVPLGSRVPRRYRCQPDYPKMASDKEIKAIALKVKPRFTSTKYGEPGYAQLHKDGPNEVFRGAEDGNEMGVFNSLQHAVRLSNLKLNLDEYTRFGLETGVFYVT
jgi:hypothetical protein